jgi:hypothetical protein
MLARLQDAARRILRIGDAPDPTPVDTPFIREMQREQHKSQVRRRAYHRQAVTRDLSQALAPPVWKRERG